MTMESERDVPAYFRDLPRFFGGIFRAAAAGFFAAFFADFFSTALFLPAASAARAAASRAIGTRNGEQET